MEPSEWGWCYLITSVEAKIKGQMFAHSGEIYWAPCKRFILGVSSAVATETWSVPPGTPSIVLLSRSPLYLKFLALRTAQGWLSVNVCWVLQPMVRPVDEYQQRASSFCSFTVCGFKFCTPGIVWPSVALRGTLETDPSWKLIQPIFIGRHCCKKPRRSRAAGSHPGLLVPPCSLQAVFSQRSAAYWQGEWDYRTVRADSTSFSLWWKMQMETTVMKE